METKRKITGNKIFGAAALAIIAIAALVLYFALADNPLEGLENTLGQSNFAAQDSLEISFIDVGQGDSILVICEGNSMLVDSGEKGNAQRIANVLNSKGIRHLDYAVATHPHSDHIGSMEAVINEFGADNVIMPSFGEEVVKENPFYEGFLDSVLESKAKIIKSEPGVSFRLGNASVNILGPVNTAHEDLNNACVVLKIVYGERSFLLTGDAEAEEESEIIASGANLKCDLLKVGHHGASGSSSPEFLALAAPEYCVISCGEGNDYGHPHDATIRRLYEYTHKIYRTDICGTVTAACDGKTIEMSYSRR